MAHKLLDKVKARVDDPEQVELEHLLLDFRLACIIHEDSAPRAEGDRVRCDALLALASNRQSVILGLTISSLQVLQMQTQELNPQVAS